MTPCRLCGQSDARVMLTLTPTPLANSFQRRPDRDAVRYPLNVQECIACGHVQLADLAPIRWQEYQYATPEAMRPYLALAAREIRARYPTARTAYEIGSNNGLYLEELHRVGLHAIGIDPCASQGIREPFSLSLARQLDPVDLVISNNVLAHVDDMQDVLAGIDHALREDGALVFEVQYLPRLMAMGACDMIYHEHRDYHTLRPWVNALRRHGFVIVQYQFMETQGGSIRLYCERPGRGVDIPAETLDWRQFTEQITLAKVHLLAQIADTEHVIAYGAPAKACTMIHHFGLADRILYCVDSTPAKQGRYLPGTDIEIRPESALHSDGHEWPILLMAWNYADMILPRYPGKRFILPFERSRQMVTA